MKELLNKFKKIYHSHDIDFYFSLLGPLTMGSIHLISLIIHFDYITLNYCLFCYLILLFKVLLWAIEKYNFKVNSYIASAINLFILLWPMMASFVLTIILKNNYTYIFEWMIYGYATYGTIKIVIAITSLIKIKKKESTVREDILSFIGLISALYTLMMMEYKLIMNSTNGNVDEYMNLLMLFTQGFIFLFSLFVLILFIIKFIRSSKIKNR